MPEENKISVGGQALMEGVMMNGPICVFAGGPAAGCRDGNAG